MPIPREKRHLVIEILALAFELLILPVIIAYAIFCLSVFIIIRLITLPWTLTYFSSNWGLLSKDRKLTRGYAETIEVRNSDVNALLRSIRRRGKPSSTTRFYPHKAERVFFCAPSIGAYSSTTYRYPILSEIFTRLEDSGWRREAIYDLFISIATDTEMVDELKKVKQRACKGEILRRVWNTMFPPSPASWALGTPKMLTAGSRLVVDVDVKGDTEWVLARGAIIRPNDEKTLQALSKLDEVLPELWKFVEKEEDLKKEGWWQYVVRYE